MPNMKGRSIGDKAIHEMQAGPELDVAVAERVMALEPCDEWEYSHRNELVSNCHEHDCYPRSRPAHYSTNAVAARLVEKEIARLGLENGYVMSLCSVCSKIGNEHTVTMDWLKMTGRLAWLVIHASPEQRCRAALGVMNNAT